MRFFSVLSLLTLLLGTRASLHDEYLRGPPPRRHDVRSPILDVCVSLNLEVVVPDIVNGILTGVGILGESIHRHAQQSPLWF